MLTNLQTICHVAGAAPDDEYKIPDIRPGDLCVAADGGWRMLDAFGVVPDVIVGDFDSSLPPKGVETLRLSPQKDVTDLFAAIQIGKERGYREFLLYGALGGSWGHSTANLQILAGLVRDGFGAAILTKRARVTALHNGDTIIFAENGRSVSILAHGEKTGGVTLEGMLYPLNNATLDCCFPLGVRNEILGDTAKISAQDGTLLIFQEDQ